MRNPFVHAVGGVLSADIAVPEHEREVEFYSAILTTGDAPLWRNDLMNNVGAPVIGLGVRTPEYDSLPLQWMPHFQVAEVAASVSNAIELGGKEIMLDSQNQWAVLADPSGAAFGIIPVVPPASELSEKNERLGRISWLSLAVTDAVSICHFYEQVVGWKTQAAKNPQDEGEEAFEMQIDHETVAAEICQSRQDGDALPSVWMIHLPVDDLDESLRRVIECGGEIVRNAGHSNDAIIRDPVGVHLALQSGR